MISNSTALATTTLLVKAPSWVKFVDRVDVAETSICELPKPDSVSICNLPPPKLVVPLKPLFAFGSTRVSPPVLANIPLPSKL